jgi:hypothetical protein
MIYQGTEPFRQSSAFVRRQVIGGENIIEASLQALVDSLEYALLRK